MEPFKLKWFVYGTFNFKSVVFYFILGDLYLEIWTRLQNVYLSVDAHYWRIVGDIKRTSLLWHHSPGKKSFLS